MICSPFLRMTICPVFPPLKGGEGMFCCIAPNIESYRCFNVVETEHTLTTCCALQWPNASSAPSVVMVYSVKWIGFHTVKAKAGVRCSLPSLLFKKKSQALLRATYSSYHLYMSSKDNNVRQPNPILQWSRWATWAALYPAHDWAGCSGTHGRYYYNGNYIRRLAKV